MLAWGLLLAAVAALGACGGGTDTSKARIRLVNASSGYSALDMSTDDTRRFSSVAYGQTDAYVEVDPDNMDSVISRPDSATPLVSLTPTVAKNKDYTVLAYGVEGGLSALVLDDNTATPDSGKSLLRVINAAPDAGAVDVYVTASGDSLADAVALQTAAAVGTLGSYVSVNSGSWRLRVTAAGSKTDVRLDVSGLNLDSEQVQTLVVTPGRGGVLVNALLLVDRGAVTRADSTQARVRVAAGVSDGGSVVAAVGGSTLMNGTAAPAVGAYALVTAGRPALDVAVNGAGVTAPATTLAAGGDYTLLVYGPAGAPQVAVIEDDNRLASDASMAKVRLVHGVANLNTALALTADFFPVADGVLPGTASAYARLAATTTAALAVTTPGASSPIFSATDQVFSAGRNYTLFMVGAAGAPVGILRADR